MREASDVGRRDEVGPSGLERRQLVGLQLARELRLQQRIRSRRAAAQVRIRDWRELEAQRQQNLLDGKRQILDFVLPGSLLGFSAAPRCGYGIETVTPCIIASMSIRQFYALLSGIPSLAIRLAEIVVVLLFSDR